MCSFFFIFMTMQFDHGHSNSTPSNYHGKPYRVPLAQLRQLFPTKLCQRVPRNSFDGESRPGFPGFPLSGAVWPGRSCKRPA
jgi:hypothetical protein